MPGEFLMLIFPYDALPEDEFLKLFNPGVLQDTIELAVCACMFLSGLRRAEIAALKPDCLDWSTPKITLKYSWQRYDRKNRVLGPTKSKKVREAPLFMDRKAVSEMAQTGWDRIEGPEDSPL
jgi:integrase